MLYGKIYADLLQHCQSVSAPSPWARFDKKADLWLLPEDTPTILADLRKKHAIKHLLRSGVMMWGTTVRYGETKKTLAAKPPENAISNKAFLLSGADKDNTSNVVFDKDFAGSYLAFLAKQQIPTEERDLTINPILCGPFNQILPLRALPTSHPYNLLTGEGTAGGQLPCCAALHDCLLQKAIQRMKFLCLTLSLADMMAFRAVGIPAVVATGLEQLTRKTVSQLAASLGLSGNGPASASPQESQAHAEQPPPPSGEPLNPIPAVPLRLFLVGWSPAQLSLHRPNALDAVQRNLTNIISFLNTNFDDMFLWRPTAAELQRVSFCLEQGNRRDVQRALMASLRRSSKLVQQPQEEQEELPGLLEARLRLREVLLRPESSSRERRRRLREHHQAVDRTFVRPLLEQATDEPDLKRRSGLAALAGANQVLYPAVELYLAKLESQVAKRGLHADGQDAEAKGLLKIFDVVGKLTKESG